MNRPSPIKIIHKKINRHLDSEPMTVNSICEKQLSEYSEEDEPEMPTPMLMGNKVL
jgi:hypothetical protein